MPKYNLTPEQLDTLIEQFVEIQVDNMDTQTLVEWVTDTLIDDYGKMTDSEIKERVDCYDEDLFDELVDNVTTTTYSLNVDESITFPVHKK